MEVGTYTNLNRLNLVVMFTCPALSRKYPFFGNFGRKNKNAGNEKDNYNFIMNFNILKDIVTEIVKCPECKCTVHIVDNKSSQMGFSHMFLISCSSCDWQKSFYSSKECNNKDIKTQGHKRFETNVRIIVGFCEIGCGFSATENFMRCRNMHSLAKTSFDKLNHEIEKAYDRSVMFYQNSVEIVKCGKKKERFFRIYNMGSTT